MMERLIGELVSLAGDPRAWFVVAGLVAITGHSFYTYLRCPLVRGLDTIAPERARAAVHAERVHSTRYLVLMLLGIGLAVAGTAMIALSIRSPLALVMIAAGLFLTQTEPVRLNIRDRQLRVVASEIEGPEAREAAIERLRTEYRHLTLINLVLAIGVAVFIVAL